jgi:hypothetical protein
MSCSDNGNEDAIEELWNCDGPLPFVVYLVASIVQVV